VASIKNVIEQIGTAVDLAGVVLIALGILVAAARYLLRLPGSGGGFAGFRQDLGRAILLGLEVLVAADIIRTVAVEPSLENVVVLGGIVLIRTFLSMSLQIELEGRLPWRSVEERQRPPTSSTV
jgi:uncharacterized membrane protein